MKEFPVGHEPGARKKRCEEFAARIRMGESDRNVLKDRWDRCQDLYFNNPPPVGEELYKGQSNEHANIVQVAVDALSTHVVGTLTSQRPYCHAFYPTKDQRVLDAVALVEAAVSFMVDRGDLESALHTVSQPAGWSNAGHVSVKWDHVRLRPKFTVIEPEDTGVYPFISETLSDAVLYWTVEYRSLSQIRALQESGVYEKGEVEPTRSPVKDEEKAKGPGPAKQVTTVPEDTPVMLYRTFFKDDDGDYWEALFSPSGEGLFLAYNKVPDTYPECQLFKFSYKNETGRGYYTKGSVVNDLQGGQLLANGLLNSLVDGIRMNSFPLIVSEGLPGERTDTRYGPGEWWQKMGASSAKMFNPSADLSYVPDTFWSVVSYQDKVSRVSSMGSGGQLRSGATATEAGGLLDGQRSGVNEYIKVFAKGLKGTDGLFACVQRMMLAHWDEWFPKFGAFLGVGEDMYAAFDLDIEWSVSASTPNTTPSSQIQAIQTMVPVAANTPALGLDLYKIGTSLVRNLQKMGVVEAGEYQYPESVDGLVGQLALRADVPAEMVTAALGQAKQAYESIKQQNQDSGPQGLGGMGDGGEMGGGGFA